MSGLTAEQHKLLLNWATDLSVLLDQDDFNKISEIFKDAVDREVYWEEHGVEMEEERE
jgi:hypothetical protein